MSDLEERSNMLTKTIDRLNRQKADALRDADQLTKQITSSLVDGKDVAKLLSTRQIKQALAEAIDPAREEAQRQLEPVQRGIKAEEDKRELERLQEERAPKQARLDEIEKLFNTPWGPTRQEVCEPLLSEQQRLAISVRMLDRQIKELQDPYHLPQDQPGALDRCPPAWMSLNSVRR